jgi:hypothetical protein
MASLSFSLTIFKSNRSSIRSLKNKAQGVARRGQRLERVLDVAKVRTIPVRGPVECKHIGCGHQIETTQSVLGSTGLRNRFVVEAWLGARSALSS